MELNDQPFFGRTVSAVQVPLVSSVSADVVVLRVEVAALKETIAHWQPSRGRSWTRHSGADQSSRRISSRNRGQSPGRALHKHGVCYYHRRFGNAAQKCAPPYGHPYSTPSTSETSKKPQRGSNGDPSSRPSPFEWSRLIRHRPTDRSSLPGRHRCRGKRSPHFPSRPQSATLPLLPTPHCCNSFVNKDFWSALHEQRSSPASFFAMAFHLF